MRTTLSIISLLFLVNFITAQNYYVASIHGNVYYQNKLLKKRDKVIPKGNIRFKSADSYVKLSGPGGLYTLTASLGKASGNEFLLTLSNELFPKIRMMTTAAPAFSLSAYPNILNEWKFWGQHYSFVDKTPLPIDPAFTANGQAIYFLHETDQGLLYKKATIRRDSILKIRINNFAVGNNNHVTGTLVVQISEPALLDSIVANYKTLDEVIDMPIFAKEENKSTNQILDILGPCKVIDRRAFIKDMRFLKKTSDAQSTEEFLDTYDFKNYISQTYGKVYELQQVLRENVGFKKSN